MKKLLLLLLFISFLFDLGFSQTKPVLTIASPQTYTVGVSITPVSVQNSGGEVPVGFYGRVSSAPLSGVLNNPGKMAMDQSGNVYIIENFSTAIRKITPEGNVSLFRTPNYSSEGAYLGIAIDASNNIYISQQGNNSIPQRGQIVKITPSGVLSVFARDLLEPADMAFNNGFIYVSDKYVLYKYAMDGTRVLVAGKDNEPGLVNANGANARFNNIGAIAFDKAGNAFVCDKDNYLVRKITPSGNVTTFVGNNKNGPLANGPGTAASVGYLSGITVDEDDNLYVVNYNQMAVRKITPAAVVSTIPVQNSGLNGENWVPPGIIYHPDKFLYVTDGTLKKVSLTGYAITPDLPFGLTMSASGVITGTSLVASEAKPYKIIAFNKAGSAETSLTISVVIPPVPPIITSLSPNTAITGTIITLTGNYLTGLTGVTIGGLPSEFKVYTPTSMLIAPPAGATSGVIVLTNPYGTATSSALQFTPKPVFTSFSPTSLPAGGKMFITGKYFTPTTTVDIGGPLLDSIKFIDSEHLTGKIIQNSHSGNVTVTTVGGSVSLPGFTFIPPPVISSVSPSAGIEGTTVILTGINFNNITGVKIGSVPAASYKVVSPNTITAVVGKGSAGGITVSSDNGSSNNQGFNYVLPPVITSFTPDSVRVHGTITISGSNLNYVTSVKFGGVEASIVSAQADRLTAHVTLGESGDVTVKSIAGTATLPGFKYLGAPVITSFSPTSGAKGDTIVITGKYFTGQIFVSIGNYSAKSFKVDSPNKITAIIGEGGSGSVYVSNNIGFSSLPGFTGKGPFITFFGPKSVTNGDVVTITGGNFKNVTSVKFGGMEASSFTINSDTQIMAKIGTGASGLVTVQSEQGTGVLDGLIHPGPSINSFTYLQGTGKPVVILGSKFTGTTAVSFGGTPAVSFTVDSDSRITAMLGNGSTGDVEVTTPLGKTTKAGFTFAPVPVITSFTPTSAAPGEIVTIKGTGLSGVTQVQFGGIPALYPYAEREGDEVVVKARVLGGASGNVLLTTPGGTASLNGFTYTGPRITSFAPLTAIKGDTVTITGEKFDNSITAVSFGGSRTTYFRVVSPTKIVALVTDESLSGDVALLTADYYTNIIAPGFIYRRAPQVYSLSPYAAGEGSSVVINGYDLLGTTSVKFGGTAAASFVINSANKITAIVGTGSSGTVTVTTPYGESSSWTGFQWVDKPVITSFTPSSGKSGETIVITGRNFSNVSSVKIGQIDAYYSANSTTEIIATIGLGQSGDITVTTAGGTTTVPGFTFIASPYITMFSPVMAAPNTTITIDGQGFSGATAVSFGETPALSFKVLSDNKITAVLGSGSTGAITVTSPKGSGTKSGFYFSPRPVITSFVPTSARAGETITITGQNFEYVNSVRIGSNFVSYNKISATTITAIVPTTTSGSIYLESSIGTASKAGFTFISSTTVTSFMPTAAVSGTTIFITGTDFTGATAVSIGGVPALAFTVTSPTTITAVVGNAGSGEVSVTTSRGKGTLGGFTYGNSPVINAFSPASAKKGATITITGENFTNVSAVKFGASEATSFTIVSPNTITAVVGEGGSGTVEVVTSEGVVSETGFTFLKPPVIASFSPVKAKQGETVTLQGENFNNASSVKFGSKEAASFAINANTITAVVGSGESGSITVVTSDGSGSLDGFTYTIPKTQLPITNFSVATTGETCKTNNDGSISIIAQQPANYIATINGNGLSNVRYPFTNTAEIKSLASGTYAVCITIDGITDYSQCYDLVVTEPRDLAVYTEISKADNTVRISLTGGTNYRVQVNGATYNTAESELTLPLGKGTNRITVTTDKECQGVVEKEIESSTDIVMFPNPVESILTVNLSTKLTKNAGVEIRATDGSLVFADHYSNDYGSIGVDLSKLNAGIYILKLKLDHTTSIHKIIKK